MQKFTGVRIGTFCVRDIGRKDHTRNGEKILHAPKGTQGRFDLIVMQDGTLVYQPVHP
jgi:hypothetical protein